MSIVTKLTPTLRGVTALPVHQRLDRVRALLRQAEIAERNATNKPAYKQAEAHRRYLAGLLAYVEVEEMQHAAE